MQPILIVDTDTAPRPNGHYSQALRYAGVVYVSGQLGRGPAMSDAEAGDITTQTHRCLTSLAAILAAAGSDLSRLLKVNIYLSDIALWPLVNTVYEKVLGSHRPARSVVPTRALHYGSLLEIDAIAATVAE